jgi:hypothetical protein
MMELFFQSFLFLGRKEKIEQKKRRMENNFLFFWSRFSFLFLKEKKRVERKVWLLPLCCYIIRIQVFGFNPWPV